MGNEEKKVGNRCARVLQLVAAVFFVASKPEYGEFSYEYFPKT